MEPSPRLEAFRQLFFQKLTRYEYRGVLGQGGMGVVFAAYDRDLDTELAIKVPTPSFEEKAPGVLARFKRELLLSRKIKHPNVARLYDFGDCEGCPYVTMELIPGVSLRTLMEREPEMPVSRVLHLFRQITKGCGAAHAEGITHRDLKPENVMVGEGDTVSILDFGLARSEKSPNLTRHGEVLGTPNYMAPEVLRGGRALPSADVYSIGVMLFRILTGSLPFERDSPLAVAMAHLQSPVPVEKLVPPRVPEAIGNLVRRCLEKDAALRYDDARELGAALDRMSEDGKAPDRRHRTEKPFGKSQQITKILSFDELPQSVRDAVANAAKAGTPASGTARIERPAEPGETTPAPRDDSGSVQPSGPGNASGARVESGPVPKVDTKPIPIPPDERPTEVVKPVPKDEPAPAGVAPRLPVILIVDDDDDLRPLLVRILTRAGFTPLAASSGMAALDTLYTNEVDLILMDVMMPGMDGFDTLRVVRSQPRFSKVPVIMMSAAADQSRKAFAQQAGAVEYLQKPMEKGELVSRIWARLSPLGFGVPATPAP